MDDYNVNDWDKLLMEIGSSEEIIEFATTPSRAFILLAQLQLALRHPDNIGGSAAIAHQIAIHLTDAICEYFPHARPLIEQGWNPAYDTTRAYVAAEFPHSDLGGDDR